MENQNNSSRGADKRYIPRWEVRNKILYSKENASSYQETSSKNINCNGACLYCDEPLIPDQKINLVLYLSESIAVEIKGKILWKRTEDHQNLIGVRFEEASPQIKEMILQYAFEYKKDDVISHWFKGW